jgi:hypothetical protein
MTRIRNDAYELGYPKPASSEVEATVCHHKNLLWARKLPDDLPKSVSSKLQFKVMHYHLFLFAG